MVYGDIIPDKPDQRKGKKDCMQVSGRDTNTEGIGPEPAAVPLTHEVRGHGAASLGMGASTAY